MVSMASNSRGPKSPHADDKLIIFFLSVLFTLGIALYWILEGEIGTLVGSAIQIFACVLGGAMLGYRLEGGTAAIPAAIALSWRLSLGWQVLSAAVEDVLTGNASYAVSNFPVDGIRNFLILGTTFILGNLTEGLLSHRIKRPSASVIWQAVAAIAAVGAAVGSFFIPATGVIP